MANLLYWFRYTLAVILFFILMPSFAQDTIYTGVPFVKGLVMPQFKDGEIALYQFLAEHMKYPREAIEKKMQGRVFVTFVVEMNGSVSNAVILKGIGEPCDDEALRVVNLMSGMFEPGKLNGQPVRFLFNLPIKFTIEGTGINQDLPVAYDQGLKQMRLEKYDKALSYFDSYKPGDDLYPDAKYVSGICKFLLADYKGAVTEWETAKANWYPGCEVKLAEAYLKLGNTYQEEKKYPASIACYTKALDNANYDINVLYNRGISYLYLGDRQKACNDWRMCLELGSEDVRKLLEEYCK